MCKFLKSNYNHSSRETCAYGCPCVVLALPFKPHMLYILHLTNARKLCRNNPIIFLQEESYKVL
uniref:Uncharacterized protein n=1 Tax=Rhizophora mucronata TaxID=61149 RepID=A0A2P2LQY0_RHIMU